MVRDNVDSTGIKLSGGPSSESKFSFLVILSREGFFFFFFYTELLQMDLAYLSIISPKSKDSRKGCATKCISKVKAPSLIEIKVVKIRS